MRREAESLLASMRLVPPREAGEALRWQDKARIVALRNDGKTQEEIAAEIGCHQSTVSRTLAELDDSRPFARKVLEANAVQIVEDILANLKDASMGEKVKLLAKLDVVRDEKAESASGVTVIVAMPGIEHPRPVMDLARLPEVGSAASIDPFRP